ncbi:MAG: hypothetical protein HY820_02345 [Acidobacteria bacterium]|nr:hypothetical protein [Acidobacteriota bacterium]
MTAPLDCFFVEREDLIERYVAGDAAKASLSQEQLAAFEEHYFGCPVCFEKLQAARAAREAMLTVGASSRRTAWIGWAAAAMVVVTSASAWYLLRPAGAPASHVTAKRPPATVPLELAKIDPPRYDAVELRGSESPADARFRGAMKAYTAARYQDAAAQLSAISSHAPSQFFAAASQLMAGNTDAAIAALQAVPPESPFAEESKWLLAKAWLGRNEPDKAKPILDALSAGGGDFAAAAARLREQLKQWEAGR